MTLPTQLILAGAGGMGQELLALLAPDIASGRVVIRGIIDDTIAPTSCFSADFPYPVLGGISGFQPEPEDRILLAIGEPQARITVAHALRKQGARFYTYVHANVIVAPNASLGEGVVIYPFCLISANTRLADFVVINTHSGAGHDVDIGESSVICAHVDLTGHVKIGSAVLVGSHASVLPSVVVGDGARIGAGAIVVRRVREQTTVYAQPARTLT